MQAAYQRFVGFWLLITLAGLMAVAAFNMLVDPAGAFPAWHLKAFEPLRYLNYDRVHKAEMARRGGWEIIILGSSRSQAGFPATHPFLAAKPTCNLSLNGAKFPELAPVFDYARRHNPLKHVILCVDLYMFSSGSRWIEDFPESRFSPSFAPFDYYCKRLLGRASTGDAWDTLRQKCKHYTPPPQTRYGFYDTRLGPGTSQRELFSRVMRMLGAGYRHQTLDPSDLELFRHVVRACRDRKIDLQVVIMPVHALDLELLYAGGRWGEFEKWKTDLVKALAEEGVEGQFNLWDFTGYAGPPAETVPPEGDLKSRMKYYFENSHCTPVLGGIMLDAMFGATGTNTFGVKLDRANLNAHLARILADRADYARANPSEVRWAQSIVAEISSKPSGSGQRK